MGAGRAERRTLPPPRRARGRAERVFFKEFVNTAEQPSSVQAESLDRENFRRINQPQSKSTLTSPVLRPSVSSSHRVELPAVRRPVDRVPQLELVGMRLGHGVQLKTKRRKWGGGDRNRTRMRSGQGQRKEGANCVIRVDREFGPLDQAVRLVICEASFQPVRRSIYHKKLRRSLNQKGKR